MSRLPRNDREENERIIEAHRVATDANPLSETEVALWIESLSKLDDVDGTEARLLVCRDLLRHAPDDAMLGSDRVIIKRAIEEMEAELEREPKTNRARNGLRVPVDVLVYEDDGADDDKSAEDPFLGFE